MKLRSICDLLKNAGSERAVITIDTTGDSASIILTVPTAKTAVDLKNPNQVALRNALSIPLAISGKIDEIEVAFNQTISDYAQEFVLNNSDLKNSFTKVKAASKGRASSKSEVEVKPKVEFSPKAESVAESKTTPKDEPVAESKPVPSETFDLNSFFDVQPL
ncbi:hypothetical protein HWA77_24180 [Photobacterium damselae subsp. damselae]|uniref:PRTRC system protein E n=1 Tax=Photobacterium damselae subsp. damselae TaxID=85581 RepID=A0A850QU95_PHODD|nr:hypothetical protein [Photobacterium damselae subsp. damselae]